MMTASALTLWRWLNCLFEDLSLDVHPGRALVVRGANGSGKTTLLRVLAGLTLPDSGAVCWDDETIERCRQAYGAELGYLGHLNGLKADLSPALNLTFASALLGASKDGWRNLVEPLALTDCVDLPVRYLSAGQKRRTALARLLLHPGRLWILDEPFSNLDDAGREWVEARLLAHLEDGGSAVLAVHQPLGIDPGRLDLLRMETTR